MSITPKATSSLPLSAALILLALASPLAAQTPEVPQYWVDDGSWVYRVTLSGGELRVEQLPRPAEDRAFARFGPGLAKGVFNVSRTGESMSGPGRWFNPGWAGRPDRCNTPRELDGKVDEVLPYRIRITFNQIRVTCGMNGTVVGRSVRPQSFLLAPIANADVERMRNQLTMPPGQFEQLARRAQDEYTRKLNSDKEARADALAEALRAGNAARVEELLNQGADPSVRTARNPAPLIDTAWAGGNKRIVGLLLQRGLRPGPTAVCRSLAAGAGDLFDVWYGAATPAPAEQRGWLLAAVDFNQLALARYFMAKGVEPRESAAHPCGGNSQTPVQMAQAKGNREFLKLFGAPEISRPAAAAKVPGPAGSAPGELIDVEAFTKDFQRRAFIKEADPYFGAALMLAFKLKLSQLPAAAIVARSEEASDCLLFSRLLLSPARGIASTVGPKIRSVFCSYGVSPVALGLPACEGGRGAAFSGKSPLAVDALGERFERQLESGEKMAAGKDLDSASVTFQFALANARELQTRRPADAMPLLMIAGSAYRLAQVEQGLGRISEARWAWNEGKAALDKGAPIAEPESARIVGQLRSGYADLQNSLRAGGTPGASAAPPAPPAGGGQRADESRVRALAAKLKAADEARRQSNGPQGEDLMTALWSGDEAASLSLLRNGAPATSVDVLGNRAVCAAAARGLSSVIRELAKRGADVNAKCYAGLTALALAAAYRRAPEEQLLLSLGASRTGIDQFGMSYAEWKTAHSALHANWFSMEANLMAATSIAAIPLPSSPPPPTALDRRRARIAAALQTGTRTETTTETDPYSGEEERVTRMYTYDLPPLPGPDPARSYQQGAFDARERKRLEVLNEALKCGNAALENAPPARLNALRQRAVDLFRSYGVDVTVNNGILTLL